MSGEVLSLGGWGRPLLAHVSPPLSSWLFLKEPPFCYLLDGNDGKSYPSLGLTFLICKMERCRQGSFKVLSSPPLRATGPEKHFASNLPPAHFSEMETETRGEAGVWLGHSGAEVRMSGPKRGPTFFFFLIHLFYLQGPAPGCSGKGKWESEVARNSTDSPVLR